MSRIIRDFWFLKSHASVVVSIKRIALVEYAQRTYSLKDQWTKSAPRESLAAPRRSFSSPLQRVPHSNSVGDAARNRMYALFSPTLISLYFLIFRV